MKALDLKPPVNRGMTLETFDKDAFSLRIPTLAARVPTNLVGSMRKKLEGATLLLPRVSTVIEDPQSSDSKLLLLNKPESDQLPTECLDVLERTGIQITQHTVTLGYDYWTANQILRSVLPEDLLDDTPASFTSVGHIAHFNIREEFLPYKYLIGRVILDKNATIQTVVNKVDNIENEFRFFPMEVLAGKPDYEVEVSEEGCKFRFDFSKVYWNSRLQAEHARLVETFKREDVIADGFAGVGPFAIPAARKGCLGVYANDLNPASASALRDNSVLNKVEHNMRIANMDGGEFFRQSVVDAYKDPFIAPKPKLSNMQLRKLRNRSGIAESNAGQVAQTSITSTVSNTAPGTALGSFIDHFVLNLPATAIDLLGCFQGLYRPLYGDSAKKKVEVIAALVAYSRARGQMEKLRLPMVHCYCFTKEVDTYEADINKRAAASLGYAIARDTVQDYSVSLVRSVAPKKDMYRLSFRLPGEVVFQSDWSEISATAS